MKVYIVGHYNKCPKDIEYCKIMEVFESMKLASEYIWNWPNRCKWMDEGYDLDSIYWVEKEVGIDDTLKLGREI